MKDYSNYNFIHEAVLYETVDKYEEQGIKHPFFIKALVPLETESGQTINIDKSNIYNKDLSWLSTYSMTSERTIDLYLPKYLMLDFPNKYIQKGTKFLVAFIGGNINNCQIIGRCYE
jgi:hypothetical protein|nr:MAG TPA: hypothetical protein [Caudoviricetes sp.]